LLKSLTLARPREFTAVSAIASDIGNGFVGF